MLNLDRIFHPERLLRAMTGLNQKAFEKLLPSFAQAYEPSRVNPDVQRQRAAGVGRKATLRTPREKLFYILVYCKYYPTVDLLSVSFGFDRSCAWDWVHGLLPALKQTLGYKQALPERKLRSIEEFLERFPEVKTVILDDTERPVQRPKDSKQQQENYSGKKKRHTRKHITGSTRKKQVILLTQAKGGRMHDKRRLEEAGLVECIPDEVAIQGDLGFQGLQNEFVNVQLPHKKPKGKQLSEQHKQENREFSRQRVVCEHAHDGIKRYRAVTDVYRNRVPDFDDRLMLNAVGLWNFYLDAA
jgi:hypothetical protein